MPILRFRDLGSVGVVTEMSNTDLPVNAWTDALNVRFDAGKIVAVGGWSPVSNSSLLGGQVPYTIHKAPLSSGRYFYASNRFIYSVFPNTSYDPSDPTSKPELRYNVTPRNAAGVNAPDYDTHPDFPLGTKVVNLNVDVDKRWTSTTCAERAVFNSAQYGPMGQTNGADLKGAFTTIPGWGKPTSGAASADLWRCESMHSYKDYLFALNMTEAAASSPTTTVNISNRVRWSDAAFDNQLPLNWYEDDENSDGGFVDLMDANSPIVDGAPLRNYFMVYTNSETYTFNFVGGTFVMENAKLFNDAGLLAKGCVAEYEGNHICVTQDDVIIHDGSQKRSIIQGVIRDRLLSEISSTNALATRVFTNPTRKEVWVCYPFSSTPNPAKWECNRAAIYSFVNQTWTFTDLPDIYDAEMGELIDSSKPVAWNDMDTNPDDQWLNQTQPWIVNSVVLGNGKFFAASAQRALMLLDLSDYRNDVSYPNITLDPTNYVVTTTPFTRFVERVGIDMDEEVEEIGRVKTWRTVYPQLHGYGTYDFELGAKAITGQSYTKRPVTTLDYSKNYKLNCLLTGRYHSLRIQTDGPAAWNISAYDVDYTVQGRR